MTITAVKERPILFNGEMVRAVLDDRKTQTRRVIKPWQEDTPVIACERSAHPGLWRIELLNPDDQRPYEQLRRCPYGQPGDHLWVRETWGSLGADHLKAVDGRKPQQGDWLVYRANPADDYQWGSDKPSQGSFVWRPSIHMPRWASRIDLEITDVRVERVQEISETDAEAEGIRVELINQTEGIFGYQHRIRFNTLWDSINAKRGYGWETNPWVWVIEFRRIVP